MRRYVEGVVNQYDLRPHLRLGNGVSQVEWDDTKAWYRVSMDDGGTATYRFVISAVGFLNVPKYPDWSGLDTFHGPAFHTARWEPEHDLAGKRVGVVGTGSSAAQVVPAIAPVVGELILFQREPGWVEPKSVTHFSESAQAINSAWGRRWARWKLLLLADYEYAAGIYRPGSRLNRRRQRSCEQYLQEVFRDRPDLLKIMTPDYPYLCKRRVKSNDFLPALRRDNVTVVPKAVTAATRSGVVDADGCHHELDVLILATGFKAVDYLDSVRVVGRDGRTLQAHWGGEPYAFLGVMVPAFPNFFMLYGPNTNGGHIVPNLEQQAKFAARRISGARRRGAVSVAVRSRPTRWFNSWLQRGMRRTAFSSGCNNYYRSASGRVVTAWPFTLALYRLMLATLGRPAVSYRRPEPTAAPGGDQSVSIRSKRTGAEGSRAVTAGPASRAGEDTDIEHR